MVQILKPRKALRVPLLNYTKHLCKSTCYAVTNLKLTSSRILSLLSLYSYTSIAGAVTPRMLSISRRQNWTQQRACTEDFFKYTEMSIAQHRKMYKFSGLY